jgi:enoyl-CoA hydratase
MSAGRPDLGAGPRDAGASRALANAAAEGPPCVRTERDGAVALLTLARPEAANALDGESSDALLAAIRAARDAGDVRALVLTGAGPAFSGGGDVVTIMSMREDRVARAAILRTHGELFWEMTRLPFPSVAAVNGPAIGAAVTLALLCDLVVMAEDAYLSDPRVALGLLDGAGGLLLWPLLTSLSAAREHLLLGDRVSAAEAYRLGLANRVVARPGLLPEATGLAHRLAALPPPAVREARRLLSLPLEQAAAWLAQASQAEFDLFDTAEHHERVGQFAERLAARSGARGGKGDGVG